MDRTNYVNKAKQLLLNTARASALVIVPLAAALTAQATVIVAPGLPTGNLACSSNAGACSGGDSVITHSGSSFSGVSFYTSGAAHLGYTSGGTNGYALTFSAFGPFTGTLPSSFPVDWDFILGTPEGITVTGWSLVFELSSTGLNNGNLGSITETGSGSGEFIGSDTLNLAAATPSNLYETAILTVNTSGVGNGWVTADVTQGGSFDFNGAAPTNAPEPASVGMFAAGIASIGVLLRRRKARN